MTTAKTIVELGFALATTLLMLAGCGPQKPSEPATESRSTNLTWQTAHGGGQYALSSYSLHAGSTSYDSKRGYRCWRAAGGFDCLTASVRQFGGSLGPTYDFDKFHVEKLPQTAQEADGHSSKSGYGCSYEGGLDILSERISSAGHTTLASNDTGFTSWEPWSARFVRNYMISNDVKGTSYFDCARLANTIRHGSIETMGTTSITKSMLH